MCHAQYSHAVSLLLRLSYLELYALFVPKCASDYSCRHRCIESHTEHAYPSIRFDNTYQPYFDAKDDPGRNES